MSQSDPFVAVIFALLALVFAFLLLFVVDRLVRPDAGAPRKVHDVCPRIPSFGSTVELREVVRDFGGGIGAQRRSTSPPSRAS